MTQVNLSTKQKQTHRHRKQTVVSKGEGLGKGWSGELGINRCKPLYTEWINNKILLCGTGHYIQYPGINHNGKQFLKKCPYIKLNHFVLQQRLKQHYQSTILQFF